MIQHAAHALPSGPAPLRPDPTRIAGISGAMLLHAGLVLLILVPLTQVSWQEAPVSRNPQAEWFTLPDPSPPPPPPRPIDPPPPPPVAMQAPMPAAQRIAVADTLTTHVPFATAAPVPTPTPLTHQPPGPDTIPAPAPPAPGAVLRYARATPPPYPAAAIRQGRQGTVVLLVRVDIDGRPLEVSIHDSSGHRDLDEAARRHVLRHWRFEAARQDGVAVRSTGLVPVDFNLDRQ